MEPIIIKGIEVFNGSIPKGYEPVKVYDFKQGATEVGYVYGEKVPEGYAPVAGEEIANKNADADSHSDRLKDKTIKMALEWIVGSVLEENKKFGLGITAVAEPVIYYSKPKVRELKNAEGLQGALTIWLNVAAYRKNGRS
jgi:hypothetical protein